MKTLSLYLAVALLSSTAVAQTCGDLTETTPVANFSVQSSGVVQDTTTGLMWMRCAYGQTWDATSSTCTGSPVQITWQDALQLSATVSFGGFSDWRLPNVKELSTIVEKMCVDPAVNATLFPATKSENFWTGSTYVDNQTRAWSIAFYNGKNNTKDKLQDMYVRFVRYAE